MNWSIDQHLRRRMALTLLALTALTVAFATGVAALLAWGIKWLNGLFGLGIPFELRLALGSVATLVAGIVILWRALRKDAAETFDAEAVGPEAYPDLHATVTQIAQTADLPAPSVHITDRECPLAMTTGLSTADAKLVVSTGLLGVLDADEVEAVIAHEFAHIKNRDATVMTLVELPLASARTLGQVASRQRRGPLCLARGCGRLLRLLRGRPPAGRLAVSLAGTRRRSRRERAAWRSCDAGECPGDARR